MTNDAQSRHPRSRPILPVHDMAEAIGFYRTLGLAVEVFDQGYAWVIDAGQEQMHLRLVPGLDPASNESGVYLHVDDADRRYGAWAQSVPVIDDLGDRPWGMREFSFEDPSGNLIRVGTRL